MKIYGVSCLRIVAWFYGNLFTCIRNTIANWTEATIYICIHIYEYVYIHIYDREGALYEIHRVWCGMKHKGYLTMQVTEEGLRWSLMTNVRDLFVSRHFKPFVA